MDHPERNDSGTKIHFLPQGQTLTAEYYINNKFRGESRMFFRRGALISCSTSTPINHIVFLQNTSCIRKPQVISVGVLTPCPLPLDPPLKLEKEVKPLSHHKNVNKADKQKFFCYD